VNADEAQLETLRAISPQASLHRDANGLCVLMPKAKIQTGSGLVEMDVVLCPKGFPGYVTRLLLQQKVDKANLNWQQVMALGRNWHTWSWNAVPAEQPWLKIFAEHARQLR
jgi:hypothetical protein